MRSVSLLAAFAGIVAAGDYGLGPDWLQYCTIPTLTWDNYDIQTITQTYTSTYCPICPEVVTTYQTVYDQFCPTGLYGQVYTVTETCAPDSCRQGLPPGFETVVSSCDVCGPSPITATLTQPCTSGQYATQTQQYVTAYPAPAGGSSTYTVTQSCAATPCPAPAYNAPAPGFTAATQAGQVYTVPVAPAAGTPAAPAPVAAQPYTGAASNNKAGALVAGVAALAALVL